MSDSTLGANSNSLAAQQGSSLGTGIFANPFNRFMVSDQLVRLVEAEILTIDEARDVLGYNVKSVPEGDFITIADGVTLTRTMLDSIIQSARASMDNAMPQGNE